MFEDNGQTNWAEANKFRQTQQEMDDIVANQRDFDERMNLVRQGIANREVMSHERDIANSTAFIASDENNGMLPADLRESLSQSLGQQVLGGVNLPDGGYAYLGPSQTEQGKVGIIGKVDALTRLKILQRSNLGDRTVGQQKMLYGMLAKKYTPTQLGSAGIHDPNRPYAVGPAIRIGGSGNLQNSMNGELKTVVDDDFTNPRGKWFGEDSGARPGYRPRFGGVSAWSTNGTNFRVGTAEEGFERTDKSDYSMPERWKVLRTESANDKDDKYRQQRVYENTKTGETVTVKDGETPPWRKDLMSDRLKIAEMQEKGRNDRNAADLASKVERQQAYLEERKALREQNERLRKMGLLYGQLGKEYDPKKKAEIQKQIDDLQKGVKDVANPDDDPSPSGAGAALELLLGGDKGATGNPVTGVTGSPAPRKQLGTNRGDQGAAQETRENTAKEEKSLQDAQSAVDDFNRQDEENMRKDKEEKARRDFDSSVEKTIDKVNDQTVNPRTRGLASSPKQNVSKGRASREGFSGGYSEKLQQSNFDVEQDEAIRERRIRELQDEINAQKREWNNGNKESPFKPSELEGKELDELMKDRTKNASRIIDEYKAERQLRDEPRQFNIPEMREADLSGIDRLNKKLSDHDVDSGFNTVLSKDEETRFEKWRSRLPENLKSDSDYDLRGYWLVYGNRDIPGKSEDGKVHLTDEFKKPNHRTFSNESRFYRGYEKYAGSWKKDGSFVPPKNRYKGKLSDPSTWAQ